MRLTLRTLLAYLDNILDPDDAQDIGKKIEESEYASGLIHRIRDCMRRLRLGAPGLTDRGPNDTNKVAEYLDNTLASEDVTDFEKVCLESDVHLAEVGSCHQILTLVLGEPAEIDPVGRERMYQIKDTHQSAGPPPTPTLGTTSTIVSTGDGPTLDLGQGDEYVGRKHRTRPTVPEYLRESRKRRHWLPTMVALVLVVCFSVVVLMALGQFDPGTPLGNTMVQWGLLEGAKPSKELAAVSEKRKGAQETVKKLPSDSAEEPIEEPVLTPSAEPANAAEQRKSDEPAKVDFPPPDAEPIIQSPISLEPPRKTVEESEKKSSDDPTVDARFKPAPPKITESGEGIAPLPPEPLGRLMSNEQVLLKRDTQGGWFRVAASEMLLPQRLLALPTYRAKVTLTVGVTLEILGGTQIEMLESGPQELPGIRILYGRVVMMPLAQPGSRLRVAFGDRSGVVTFPDAESVAAMEVRRLDVPGSNPESGPPHIVADLYASTDSVLWDEIGSPDDPQTLRLTAPQQVSFNVGLTSESIALKALPRWIKAEPISQLDRRASEAIEKSLQTNRLARLELLELATSRPQKEVRWLALRCLGYLGQYHDMVAAINNPDQRLDWPEYIEQLRAGTARNATSAEAIHMALEKQYPQKAAILYRMLWGYSDDDLQTGADAKLVSTLDDDTLAVRVLGFWNLKNLTGLGLFYRPEQTAAKRQQPIRRWNERLHAGEIRLKMLEGKAGANAE